MIIIEYPFKNSKNLSHKKFSKIKICRYTEKSPQSEFDFYSKVVKNALN